MFGSYYYPYYRSPGAIMPYPYYGAYNPYYNYLGINAYQSQLSNQTVTNTGIAAGINQIANPINIY